MRTAATLLALCALAASAPPEVADFKRDFAPGMTLSTREGALRALSLSSDPEAVSAFSHALAVTRARVEELSAIKAEAEEELRRLEKSLDDTVMRETERARKDGRDPGEIKVPATLLSGIEDRRREVEARQAEIDDEYSLRESAAESLGGFLDALPDEARARVLKDLAKGPLADSDHVVRGFYVRALGAVSRPEVTRLLLQRFSAETDPRVLPALVDAAARQAGEAAVPDIVRLLGNERWPVRAAAVAALSRIRSPTAVDPLIARMPAEDGRLRADIAAALKAITGQDLGLEPGPWKEWWQAHREGFRPPSPGGGAVPGDGPAPAGGETVSFYGIRIVSKAVVFVIDVSNSMNQEAAAGRSKVQVARYELRNAILGLPEGARFNIVFYHHEVFVWRPAMVEAKGATKREAAEFVEAMTADGNTNMYDALERAFRFAGMGARDKQYEVGADTIFLLSDGKPNRGGVVDPAGILAEVRRWNELKRVTIHSVGVGKDHDVSLMRGLADSSGGTYVSR